MKQLFLTFCCIAIAMTSAAQDLAPAADDTGKWGYKKDDHWVINPIYENAFSFSEGMAGVRLKGKMGFINPIGETIIAMRYEEVWPFSERLAAVKLNGKWGFINAKGQNIIPYKYDETCSFSNGLAGVKLNGKWGFIDIEGKTVIPFKYDYAKPFADGLASVRKGSASGFIDKEDKWYESKEDYHPTFTEYAKRYVENKVEAWQKKGKFEKTADWKSRTSEENRKAKISALTREAEKLYLTEEGRSIQLMLYVGGYDADNETFLIKDKTFGELLVPVPIAEAPDFEKDFYKMKQSVRYFVENDKIALAELTFTNNEGKSYQYSNAASLDYFIANIDYRFAPIEIDSSAITRMQRGQQNIRQHVEESDVDINIPRTRNKNEETFAVIIANENYKHEERVPYAINDGETFKEYCMNTLGLPESRIHFCADATLNEIRMEMNWLRDIGEAFSGEAKVIFYYAGHGIPNEENESTYLLPIDGSGKDPDTGYELATLYTQLGQLPIKSATVFLDACFSGSNREGGMLTAARGVALKKRSTATPSIGNIVVFSATQGDETAFSYPQKNHGLFTYFLLKKLQESKGNTTLGELAEYIKKYVSQESVVTNRKSQTPTILYTPNLSERWEELKLN